MRTSDRPPELLSPQEMPTLPGLIVPAQFYLVTRQPGLLAGMPYPTPDTPWQALYDLGIRHVVSLHSNPHRPYNPDPLLILCAVHLQDLFSGDIPDDPQRELELIGSVVRVAGEALQAGQGVVLHCAGGTGRTGTLIGCLLVRLGLPARSVISYLDTLNGQRGNAGWPESPWQAEVVVRFSTST
jgi:protein-tyrosine phosphatase